MRSRWRGLAGKLPCLPGDWCLGKGGACWEAKSHEQLKAPPSSHQGQTSHGVPCSTCCSDIQGQPGSFHSQPLNVNIERREAPSPSRLLGLVLLLTQEISSGDYLLYCSVFLMWDCLYFVRMIFILPLAIVICTFLQIKHTICEIL